MLMKHFIILIVDHDTDKHNNDAFIKMISFKTNRRARDGSIRRALASHVGDRVRLPITNSSSYKKGYMAINWENT